jgi:hypothetical protein
MYGRTLRALVVLERLEASESGTSGDQFMAEAGLVFVEVVVLVDLLVVVFVLVCVGVRSASGLLGERSSIGGGVPQKPIAVVLYVWLT